MSGKDKTRAEDFARYKQYDYRAGSVFERFTIRDDLILLACKYFLFDLNHLLMLDIK